MHKSLCVCTYACMYIFDVDTCSLNYFYGIRTHFVCLYVCAGGHASVCVRMYVCTFHVCMHA